MNPHKQIYHLTWFSTKYPDNSHDEILSLTFDERDELETELERLKAKGILKHHFNALAPVKDIGEVIGFFRRIEE